jgi:hypothetical protein
MFWEMWQRILFTWKFHRLRVIGYLLMFLVVALIIAWLMIHQI